MLYMRKQEYMRVMNKDTIALKERIIALIDECNIPYVIPLLNDLENTAHEISFESGYGIGYDVGWESGFEWANERGSYK